MEPFVGEIRAFPFTFAPVGWALCNGQLLPISQNTALFAIIGTYYGGDGRSTFALPDLQGRVPVGAGAAPGLSSYVVGDSGGAETVALLTSEMPSHDHQLRASSADASVRRPAADRSLAVSADGNAYAPAGAGVPTPLHVAEAAVAGGGAPHNNLQPTLVFNYCIALQGVFPPRS